MGYTKGTRWSIELIKEKVLEVKNALELDRMPSTKECALYFQNHALTNAISKRMGWYALAKEMNLPIKGSETFTGKSCEAEIYAILHSRGFSVERMSTKYPYDLLVDGCVKVDVKASRIYHGRNGDFFTFNLEKKFPTCDVYILAELDSNGDIVTVMVIPSKFVLYNTQISVGVTKSKYHGFIERWDYISNLSDFWERIVIA